METIRLSSKGQIVIPKEVRDRLHWEAGTELIVERRAEGIVLRSRAEGGVTRVRDGLGMLARKARRGLTQEAMDSGVIRIVRKRDRESRK
jgi:AbrB family looped-hinge helix DNA binding protein